jgi:transcriptional regulator with XRE-family HTH domain
VIDISSILVEVGARLRDAREARGMNQAEFGSLAAVTRGSQAEYELGKRPFSASYIIAMQAHGIDMNYVLTGKHTVETMSADETSFLVILEMMKPADREALFHLACSLGGVETPAPAIKLPSTSALTQAFGGVIEGSPGLAGDELAHELATRLPIILRSAEDEIVTHRSSSIDDLDGLRANRDDDRRAARPAQRT